MFTLTDSATTAVTAIIARSPQATTGGLRISSTPVDAERSELAVGFAGGPEESDTVIIIEGARVFLDVEAGMVLADKMLDAAPDERGAVRFEIVDQSTGFVPSE